MPFATARTVSLHGAVGHLIDVQTDVSPGQVGLTPGRPSRRLAQRGPDRCRMAVVNSRLEWPATRRITVLLSPADLAKRGTHFDLAIAVSVLAAAGERAAAVPRSGTVVHRRAHPRRRAPRPVPGVLPMVLAAAARGVARVFVPEPQAQEAAMVPGMVVIGMRSLAQVVAELRGDEVPEAPPVAPMSGQPAAVLARLRAARGARHGRRSSGWPTPGTPSRSPRPAATT